MASSTHHPTPTRWPCLGLRIISNPSTTPRSTRTGNWLAFGPNQLHVIKNSAIQILDFQQTNTYYALQVIAHDQGWKKGVQMTSGVNDLSPILPPRNPINSTILTELANSLTFKFSEPIDSAVLLGPVSSR